MESLYDRDVAEWASQNAELLRNRRFEEADIENIAEEIEDLGKSARRSLSSYLTNLTAHLLKWQFQPERRSRNWTTTIANLRIEMRRVLRDSPSLKARLTELLKDAYHDAVRLASAESGLAKSAFPSTCPYSLEQLLDDDYLP